MTRLGLLQGGWRHLPFEPFRDGVEVHWLERGDGEGAAMALLRYAPGAGVPRHRHPGIETILVLEGTQSDDSGEYREGDLVMNGIGSEHEVWSKGGCVVLIQWARPVIFLDS